MITPLDAPYPGLRPFTSNEATVFCGRSQHRIELLTKLEKSRFVAVVGASGSGKSSLVMAGLLPDISDGLLLSVEAGTSREIYFRPGLNPFASLAAALAEELEESPKEIERLLRRSARGIEGVIDQVPKEKASDDNPESNPAYIIIADQFEELFRFADLSRSDTAAKEFLETRDHLPVLDGAHNEAQSFIDLLLEATRGRHNVFVILTMRSDFLQRCEAFDRLPGMISRNQYLTPRLERCQLEDAIVVPQKYFESSFEPELVNRILNDLSPEQDQLPSLQHALSQLWQLVGRAKPAPDSSKPSRLQDIKSYREIGGINGSLDHNGAAILMRLKGERSERIEKFIQDVTAAEVVPQDSTVERVLTEYALGLPEAVKIARNFVATGKIWLMPAPCELVEVQQLFQCLGQYDPLGMLARRPRTVKQIMEETSLPFTSVRVIADAFRAAGNYWLMPLPSQDLRETSVLDLTHESILRKWTMLSHTSGWMATERDRRNNLLRLRDRMLECGWKEDMSPPSYWAKLRLTYSPFSSGLISGSQYRSYHKVFNSPVKPTEAWALRYQWSWQETSKFLRLSTYRNLVKFTILIFFLIAIDYYLQGELAIQSIRTQLTADSLKASLERAQADAELAAADAKYAQAQKDTATVGKIADSKRTVEDLQKTNAAQQLILSRLIALGSTTMALKSQDAITLKTTLNGILDGSDKTPAPPAVAQWPDLLSGPVSFPAHTEPVKAVAFIMDGTTPKVVSGSTDNSVKLWPLNGNQKLMQVISKDNCLSIAPNGEKSLILVGQQTLSSWTLGMAGVTDQISTDKPSEELTCAMALDGRIAFGTTEGRVGFWMPGSTSPPTYLPHPEASVVNGLDFLSKRKYLLVSCNSTDSNDPGSGAELWNLGIDVPAKIAVIFGKDKMQAASFDKSGELALVPFGAVNISLIQLAITADGTSPIKISSSQMRDDGPYTIGTYSPDGKLISKINTTGFYLPHQSPVTVWSVSPDGKLVATGDNAGRIYLWQIPAPSNYRNKMAPVILSGHTTSITKIEWSPDASYVVTADSSGLLLAWSNPAGRASGAETSLPMVLPSHQDAVTALAISSDGNFIASGSKDLTLRITPMEPTFAGKCLTDFGGPYDSRESATAGLALFDDSDAQSKDYAYLFLNDSAKDPDMAGLARRLNPQKYYIAARWDYTLISRSFLRTHFVTVRNKTTHAEVEAQPVDWGPNVSTGAIADLSPGTANKIGVKSGDEVEVVVHLIRKQDGNGVSSEPQ